MRSRAPSWLVTVGLAGCNQFFGISETVPIDADTTDATIVDRDEDGVLDVIDNCPDIANPLQENQDGDPFGDACDACLQGGNADEDGDGALDGCDNCPHIANDKQDNVDGDALGDVCDPDNAVAHTRAAFDGFAEPLSLLWIPEVALWESSNGAAHETIQPLYYETGMWSRFIEVLGKAWVIETAVTVDDAAATQRVGLYTRSRAGALDHGCYLEQTAMGWALRMAVNDPNNPTVPLTASADLTSLPPQPIRLRLRLAAGTIFCDIPGVVTLSLASVDTRTGAGFIVTSMVPRFLYLEAASSP